MEKKYTVETEEEMLAILTQDISSKELDSEAFIVNEWKLDGVALVKAVRAMKRLRDITPMSFNEFLKHCYAQGGDWGGMLLSGIKELYPLIWEMIPEELGIYGVAVIFDLLRILEIKPDEK